MSNTQHIEATCQQCDRTYQQEQAVDDRLTYSAILNFIENRCRTADDAEPYEDEVDSYVEMLRTDLLDLTVRATQ